MKPSVRLIGLLSPVDDPDYDDHLPIETPNHLMEFAGRWDYGEKSIAKIGTDPTWLSRRLSEGEESMVEMGGAMFLITCSRVVSHELVRHRIASYQQESQRFVNYREETTDKLFFVPPELSDEDRPAKSSIFYLAMHAAFDAYEALLAKGVPKQIARYVLPNATRTRIVVLMNPRQWRHVVQLRLNTSAQPEMQEVMALIHAKLNRIYGDDLFPANIAEKRGAR